MISDSEYAFRLLFNITFFIIVTIILLNIIFGIIVDTFAALRDERREIEEDIEKFALCVEGNNMSLNLKGGGWNKHIQKENNIWAYLGFVIYIKKNRLLSVMGLKSI